MPSSRRSRTAPSAHGEGYLSLRSLAARTDISVRTLRKLLSDPMNPLPHYRIGGMIRVEWTEFRAWTQSYRAEHRQSVRDIVDDVVGALR